MRLGFTDLSPHASVQLGHRRLSIIDLSAAADQPFVEERPALDLQRRAVQLSRAPQYPPRQGRRIPHRVGHRGCAGGLAAVGACRSVQVPRDVRVRAVRRTHWRTHPGARPTWHQADVRHAARQRHSFCFGAQGSGDGGGPGTEHQCGRTRGFHPVLFPAGGTVRR